MNDRDWGTWFPVAIGVITGLLVLILIALIRLGGS